ncbi:hypothetical protein GW17_00043055 [Ensete ventricosum]|nr:hypothetical protein GW17_00043055 [Ensete ventricosum]
MNVKLPSFSKGYSSSVAKIYVEQTQPNFVVAEIWSSLAYGNDGKPAYDQNGNRQELVNWVQQVGGPATAFDFTTKGILQAAVEGELWRMRDSQGKAPGMMGWWPEKAVTFVDNHDTGSTQIQHTINDLELSHEAGVAEWIEHRLSLDIERENKVIAVERGSQQRKMVAPTYEGCGYRQRKGECIGHRRKTMCSRRKSRRGPTIVVNVKEDVSARRGGSQLQRLLLLCGLQHFYDERSKEARAEKRCYCKSDGGALGGRSDDAEEIVVDLVSSCPTRRQQDEAPSTATKEDVGEETAAATGATTRWVWLEAAGRDEVAIEDDDATATEVVTTLKMSWPEIWRHCRPSTMRNMSLSPRVDFHRCMTGEDGRPGRWTSEGYY